MFFQFYGDLPTNRLSSVINLIINLEIARWFVVDIVSHDWKMYLALMTTILIFAGPTNGEEEFTFSRVTLVSDAEKFKATDGFKMIYHVVNSGISPLIN